ncbi:unnamed protein product [Onchocerca flexuosa]|uniref:Secreted protein n=1 Tax=Onchocerca flexuosa TaxID=387005 RepID=A0A183HQE0_9BILA|nr:unnamed protein product [Onchocerca flexuosa]
MKFEFTVLLLLSIITSTIQICDYITLVKCFINILDEWAWTLYELKDNVVTINANQCEHLRQLDLCIKVNLVCFTFTIPGRILQENVL